MLDKNRNNEGGQAEELYKVKTIKRNDGIWHVVVSPSGNVIHQTPDRDEAHSLAEKLCKYFGK